MHGMYVCAIRSLSGENMDDLWTRLKKGNGRLGKEAMEVARLG